MPKSSTKQRNTQTPAKKVIDPLEAQFNAPSIRNEDRNARSMPAPRAEDRIKHQDPSPPRASDRATDQDPPPPSTSDRSKDQSAAAPDIADKEKQASESDGQDSAEDGKEKKLKGAAKRRAKVKEKSSQLKKKILVATGIAGATAAVAAVVLLPSIALRAATDKIKDAFMDRVTHVTEKAAQKYVTRYIYDVTGSSLDKCGHSISRNCAGARPGDGPLKQIFTKWRDNGIEEKLFQNHGIEFEKNKNSDTIRVFKTDSNGKRTNLGDMGKNSVSKEVSKIMRQETKFKGVLERRHIRNILDKKYGARRWCLIICKTKDKVSAKKTSTLNRLKSKLAAKVAVKANARASAYILCAISGCSPADLDRESNKAARKAAGEVNEELLEKLSEATGKGKKLSQVFIDELIEKVQKEALKGSLKTGAKAVPVAGWILAALEIALLVDTLDQHVKNDTLSNFINSRNAAAYADYSAEILTLRDETVSYQSSLADAGAAMRLVNGFTGSRVYQSVNNSGESSKLICTDGTVVEKDSPELICPEQKVRGQEQFFFEEIRDDPTVSFAIDALNLFDNCALNPLSGIPIIGDTLVNHTGCFKDVRVRQPVGAAVDGLNWAVAKVGGVIIDGFRLTVPGFAKIMDAVSGKAEEWSERFLPWAIEKLFPLAINLDAEGSEVIDQLAGGLDVSANAFAQGYTDEEGQLLGLGAPEISVEDQAKLDVAILNSKEQELKNKSIFDRYLDINDHNSLASITAVSMVSSASSIAGTSPTLSPTSFISSFGSILGLNSKVGAVSLPTNRESIFGVTQYGYADDNEVYDVDLNELTPEVCEQYAKDREDSSYRDETTGEIKYSKGNPCMLYGVVADSLTKIFDLDEEQPDGVDYTFDSIVETREDTSSLECAAGASSEQIGNVGNTVRVKLCSYGGIQNVNASWSAAVSQMAVDAEAANITLTGSSYRSIARQIELRKQNCNGDVFTKPSRQCSPPTARPGSSNHEVGLAIDFSSMTTCNGNNDKRATCAPNENAEYDWMKANASRYGIKKLTTEAWHWSVNGR